MTDIIKGLVEVDEAHEYVATSGSEVIHICLNILVHKLVECPRLNPNWNLSRSDSDCKYCIMTASNNFEITPVIYKGSPRCQWKTHKCLGGRLCCHVTYRSFQRERRQSKWWNFRNPTHRKKFSCEPMVPMESVWSEGVPFWGSQPNW